MFIEIFIPAALYLFGLAMWLPFLRIPPLTDRMGNILIADRLFNGKGTLYRDIGFTYYPIGVYLMYGLIRKYISKDTRAINIFTALYCSTATVLVYFITLSCLHHIVPAILASILFSIYLPHPRTEGCTIPYDAYTLPWVCGAFLILISSTSHSALMVIAGMLYGISLLIKQTPAAYFPLFLIIIGIFSKQPVVISVLFCIGALSVHLPTAIYFSYRKALKDYLLWNWFLPFSFVIFWKKMVDRLPRVIYQSAGRTFYRKLPSHIFYSGQSLFPLILLAASSVPWVLFREEQGMKFVLVFCAASYLTVSFAKIWLAHFLQNVLPWTSILAACSLWQVVRTIQDNPFTFIESPVSFFFVISFLFLLGYIIYEDLPLFRNLKDPYDFLRIRYQTNSFREQKKAGEFLSSLFSPANTLLVCGNGGAGVLYYSRCQPYFPAVQTAFLEDYLDLFSRSCPHPLWFLKDYSESETCPSHIKHNSSLQMKGPDAIIIPEKRPEKEIKDVFNIFHRTYTKPVSFGTIDILLASEYSAKAVSMQTQSTPTCKEHVSTLNSLQIGHEDRVLLLATRPMGETALISLVQGVLEFVSKQAHYHTVIKLHPEEDEKPYRWLIDTNNNSRITVTRDFDLNEILSIASLCITPYSTVTFKAIDRGIPVILVDLNGGDIPFKAPSLPNIFDVSSIEELHQTMRKFL